MAETESDATEGRDGPAIQTPTFMPVFEPDSAPIPLGEMRDEFGVGAVMVNAYFLYRRRRLRRLLAERGIKEHLAFDGLVATDSGAFQAFRRRLYLRNRSIVRFQEQIGADIVSPLDVVTPPGDNFSTAEGKLGVTMRRIAEGLELVESATLIGVQQGGRFPELRRRAAEGLADLGVRYVALGSLVPFFTRNHDLGFVGRGIADARRVIPGHVPIHLYGAGDPLELPFYVALGCNVFDSSSYVHYAESGACMTPFGALPAERAVPDGFECACPFCRERGAAVRRDPALLCRHNLWTILDVARRIRAELARGALEAHCNAIADRHQGWFPESLLAESWEEVRQL